MAKRPPPRPFHRPKSPATSALEAKFEQGLALHRRGDTVAAERVYHEILKLTPGHFGATHMLGIILRKNGKPALALEHLDRAIAINPKSATAHNNRGNILRDLGRQAEALASYDRALELTSDYVEAFNNRGYALLDLKRLEEALASFEAALAIDPRHAEALNNHGATLWRLQRFDEALTSLDQAVALNPDYAEAWINRANALESMHRSADALASLDHALRLKPQHPVIHYNRGNALRNLKRFAEAVAAYDQAITLKPQHTEALNNRGRALLDLRRREEALASFDAALALDPTHAHAQNNRALALSELKRYEEAAAAYARLLEIAPDYIYAPGNMFRAQLQCSDWSRFQPMADLLSAAVRDGKPATTPFAFLAASDSAAAQLQCSRIYVADRYPPVPASGPTVPGQQHDKIRIAYLSADFHSHATAYLMAELFESHDRDRFETTAISFGSDDKSDMRARLEAAFDHFVDVRRLGNAEIAQGLREREIDIAVDLKGFTTDCRPGILAGRPAPIQINYLGYPGTMAAPYIDYIIADRQVIPAEQRAFYTEKIAYLPGSYQVNDSKRAIADWSPTRMEVGLPEQGFVFCCFNNNYKITPAVFDIWMRLLGKTPGSVLWLFEDNAAVARNLRREAASRGVAPERLVFAPRLKLDRHLARQKLADLFLDTLPINAHTTASDALWAGLPMITCEGNAFAGRVASSLLHAVGLPELVTRSLEEYEGLAQRLASEPAMLAGIKAKLAAKHASSPLFDTRQFCRHIETAYAWMWERHRRGESPASFAVADDGHCGTL